jgi:phage tail sheath gpL-like
MAQYPKTSINIVGGPTPTSLDTRTILIIGQKTNSGTATSGELKSNLLTNTDFNTYFGKNSQLAIGGRALVKQLSISQKKPVVSAIGLSDSNSGAFSSGAVVFTGTATASGTITIYIDSKNNGKYEVAVAIGDTATAIGTKLTNLINANDLSPVTAINTAGSVALTAVNKGIIGNNIGLKYEGVVAGVATNLTAMANGSGTPALTGLFDVIANQRFTTIVYPAEFDISVLTNLLESRINVDNQVLDGVGFVSSVNTYANHNSIVDNLNYKTLSYFAINKINEDNHKGGSIFENPLAISCNFASLRELRIVADANISRIMSNGESLGGAYNAGIPYANTISTDLPAIQIGHDFLQEERDELNVSGATCPTNSGFNIEINKVFTTYKFNTQGEPDLNFQSLNKLDILSIVREYLFKSLKKDFAQHTLTTGNIVAGRKMVNADIFVATMGRYYIDLSGLNNLNTNYALLVASNEALESFKEYVAKNIIINMMQGKITTPINPSLVSQLEEILITLIPNNEV